jgi:beta-galactosidase
MSYTKERKSMKLGCCYYPEHWPEELWLDDARRMREMGLSQIRIGEFAWSRIEPEPGQFNWDWLDRIIQILSDAGLEVILGTPTATPPKWLVDQMPDMIALDINGNPRRFGSRRHYCFSHEGYRIQCTRIVKALAARYGNNPAIAAWQTDNEYGCHNTVVSYSEAAAQGFRDWLASQYHDIEQLNSAWGNVFWSMEYRSFGKVDPPNLTVTEPNPSHMLDYRRFSSDQVVAFNRLQSDILRAGSPGREIIHNYMGFFTEFDHHKVGQDLDVASWDSYPLGFLEQFWFSEDEKHRFARQGHPDIAAFHHDLYRGCCKNGRWSVMEQQPGPVNWAQFNPAPLDGMVRLWTLEALAHGAELVSYFRWRQVPFAQEQMHAGLLRPDGIEAQGALEAAQAALDIACIGETGTPPKSVALLFSYDAAWLYEAQPQGRSFHYIELVYEMYTALRRLGLDVDIVSAQASLDGYKMVVIPTLPIISEDLVRRIEALNVPVLCGPRTGSKTENCTIPADLAPGLLQRLIPLKIIRVQSLRNNVELKGHDFTVTRWVEDVETQIIPSEVLNDGQGILFSEGNLSYLAGWPDAPLLKRIFTNMAKIADLPVLDLPDDVRIRRLGDLTFAFNYGSQAVLLTEHVPGLAEAKFILGAPEIESAQVAVWRN